MYLALAIFIGLVLALIYIIMCEKKKKERMITQRQFGLISSGLNLSNKNGNYLGAMGVLHGAENADTLSDIQL